MAAVQEATSGCSDILANLNGEKCVNCSELITELINKLITANDTINNLKALRECPQIVNNEHVAYSLETSNRFQVLQCDSVDCETLPIPVIQNSRETAKTKRKNVNSSVKQLTTAHKVCDKDSGKVKQHVCSKRKVMVAGDSHARDIAKNLHISRSNEEIQGIIKPGGRMGSVLEGLDRNNKKDDIILIMGGANDVSKNESQTAVRALKEMLHKLKDTAVHTVVIGVPHRHDLSEESCVNKEVKMLNKQLKALSKTVPLTNFLDVSHIERKYFTRHGLHLNKSGKRRLTCMIDSVISRITERKTNIIALPYVPTVDKEILKSNHSDGDSSELLNLQEVRLRRPTSTRQRKPPAKLEDFLSTRKMSNSLGKQSQLYP